MCASILMHLRKVRYSFAVHCNLLTQPPPHPSPPSIRPRHAPHPPPAPAPQAPAAAALLGAAVRAARGGGDRDLAGRPAVGHGVDVEDVFLDGGVDVSGLFLVFFRLNCLTDE